MITSNQWIEETGVKKNWSFWRWKENKKAPSSPVKKKTLNRTVRKNGKSNR